MMKKITWLMAFMMSLTASAQGLEGVWKGKLQAGPQALTLVLHVEPGQGKVTIDVIEQSADNIAMLKNHLSSDSINVSVPSLGLNIAGKLLGEKLVCTFRQATFSAPMTFERGTVTFRRPQEPKAPYPYATSEVTFGNPKANVTLAGTLTLPEGYKAGDHVPVVLMVTGSGAQDRNEEVFHHKYFLVIADWLARNGIASLRYDDRGTGQSTGDFAASTTADFAADAAEGLRYLRGDHRFSKVGILGHSEGGSIAYLLGQERLPDFIVSMAGPACRIDTLMMEQLNGMSHAMGMTSNSVNSVAETRQLLLSQADTPWMRYFLDMDLAAAVKATHCPVLALGGEKDLNVPVSLNVPALHKNLPATEGNAIKVYPGLGHTFQPCDTGMPTEYASIEETIAPEVLKDISDWILAQAKN